MIYILPGHKSIESKKYKAWDSESPGAMGNLSWAKPVGWYYSVREALIDHPNAVLGRGCEIWVDYPKGLTT